MLHSDPGQLPATSRFGRPAGKMLAGSHWLHLVQQIDPRPNDIIADIGCGTGKLAVMLKLNSPASCVYGFDPNPATLDRAERRSYAAGAMVHFVHATLDDVAEKIAARRPTQAVVSRVLHRLSLKRRKQLLKAVFDALPCGGRVHVADVGWHGSSCSDTSMRLLEEAGFEPHIGSSYVLTATGIVGLYRGIKS